jgi:hypothetical protein
LHRVLGADEAEVLAEFRDESAKVVEQSAVQVGLGVAVGQTEELEAVGILDSFSAAG